MSARASLKASPKSVGTGGAACTCGTLACMIACSTAIGFAWAVSCGVAWGGTSPRDCGRTDVSGAKLTPKSLIALSLWAGICLITLSATVPLAPPAFSSDQLYLPGPPAFTIEYRSIRPIPGSNP